MSQQESSWLHLYKIFLLKKERCLKECISSLVWRDTNWTPTAWELPFGEMTLLVCREEMLWLLLSWNKDDWHALLPVKGSVKGCLVSFPGLKERTIVVTDYRVPDGRGTERRKMIAQWLNKPEDHLYQMVFGRGGDKQKWRGREMNQKWLKGENTPSIGRS